ncbi:unnamed protein product [Parajaminaea phylloscopi]
MSPDGETSFAAVERAQEQLQAALAAYKDQEANQIDVLKGRLLCAEVQAKAAKDQLQGVEEHNAALKAQNNDLAEQVAQLSGHVAELKGQVTQLSEQNAQITTRYEEDKADWKKFKQWWDRAIAAKQGRKEARRKPLLSKESQAVLAQAGLATPDAISKAPVQSQAADAASLDCRTKTPMPGACATPRAHNAASTGPAVASGDVPITPVSRRVPPYRSVVPPNSNASERIQEWVHQVVHENQMVPTPANPAGSIKKVPVATGAGVIEALQTSSGRHLRSVLPPQERISDDDSSDAHSSGGVVRTSLSKVPRPVPERPLTQIKAESDDESDRRMARQRHLQPGDPMILRPEPEERTEVSLKELRERRRLEMQELKSNPAKYRGRGRYSEGRRPGDKDVVSIAAAYEIIPHLNGGVAYEHRDVIRDKRTRRQMHAHDCPCCKDYWDTVGRMATADRDNAGASSSSSGATGVLPSSAAAWRRITSDSATALEQPANPAVPTIADCTTAKKETTASRPLQGDEPIRRDSAGADHYERMRELGRAQGQASTGQPGVREDSEEAEQTRLAEERRQQAGRHRAWGQPAPTPEGYWEIGFPDTPRHDAINAAAEAERKRKLARVEKDKRYRRRVT